MVRAAPRSRSSVIVSLFLTMGLTSSVHAVSVQHARVVINSNPRTVTRGSSIFHMSRLALARKDLAGTGAPMAFEVVALMIQPTGYSFADKAAPSKGVPSFWSSPW